MNKTELVEKIAVGAELSKADAKKALEAAVEAIKTALVEGDKVQLIGSVVSKSDPCKEMPEFVQRSVQIADRIGRHKSPT